MTRNLFRFKHSFNEEFRIAQTKSDFCIDVVRTFFYFLLSVGFAKINILDAFKDISEENETYEDRKEKNTESN